MSEKPENPSAFPVSSIDGFTDHGMTLRDWFVGHALTNPYICDGEATDREIDIWFGNRSNITKQEIVAVQAHSYADALLAEREKGQ